MRRVSIVLAVLAITFFGVPAHGQMAAAESLPDAPSVHVTSELPERASAGTIQDVQQSPPNPASPQQAPPPERSATQANGNIWRRKYLFGDWNGERTRLEKHGVTFDFNYIGDALGNPYGGRADFGNWGRVRGTVDVDFSKFTRARGLTFHMTGVWQYGTDLSTQYTFTAVDSSSLPSAHTFRADSYFLQQYLFNHRLAVRGGQIAAYDSYGDSEYGTSFVNLAMGYAHSNLNSAAYLSFNPAGVPSFEVKVLPTDSIYVKGMVQSEERDPYTIDPTGFTFHLGGPVVATEAGYLHDPPKPPDATNTMGTEPFITDRETGNHPGVYRFGAGYDPHNFTDLLSGASSPGNYVLYGQVDQAVYRLAKTGEDSTRGLDLTYSEDYAPGDVTQYSHQIWAGARWIGPGSGRWSKDTISLGYVRTAVGSHYSEAFF
ncbi:MAG: porin, partial [Acidobacteriaceae bacterium]|nr:porin [Acidobacteriaceae bacterium]